MKKKVYDLKNAGPNNRFVVRAKAGSEPMIVHNCTQRVSRDLLCEAMLQLDPEYPIIFHVHDEVVSLVDDSDTKNLSGFNAILGKVPTWAEGLPLAVEGWEGYRYRKD